MVGGRFVIVAHWGEQWERQGWRERYGRAEEVVAFSFKIGTQRKNKNLQYATEETTSRRCFS